MNKYAATVKGTIAVPAGAVAEGQAIGLTQKETYRWERTIEIHAGSFRDAVVEASAAVHASFGIDYLGTWDITWIALVKENI